MVKTENQYERLFQTVFSLAALLVTALVFVLVGQGQVESDTLWHIKAGRWILENGIPYTDPFSWTMRGEEWFAHEWLWEISAALIFDSFGPIGLWLFTCLWLAIFCGVLWTLLRRKCSLPRAVLIYSFVTLSSFIYWSARPHPMAQALFAFTLFILLSCREKPGLLMLLPPVVLVWANVHGSAPLGVLMAAFYWLVTSERINLRGLLMERLTAGSSRLLAIATAGSFAASLVNPHGPGLWLYMWEATRNPLITGYIMEWQPPNFHNPVFWPLIIMALAVIWLLYTRQGESKSRVSLFEMVLVCGFLFLALQQKRHAPYFYLTSALVLGGLAGQGTLQATRLSTGLKAGLAMLALTSLATLAWFKPPVWIENGNYFPVAAVEHLRQHEVTDRLFNQYDYGGYLIWMDMQPFIDGRADMYALNSSVFKDYLLLTKGGIKNGVVDRHWPQHYLDKYEIETTLIASGSRLDLYLINHQQWVPTFRDEHAVVYRRTY